jgi:hypothetical protein
VPSGGRGPGRNSNASSTEDRGLLLYGRIRRAGQSRHGLPDRTAVRCDDAVALVRFTGDRGPTDRLDRPVAGGQPLVPTHPHRVRDRRLARAVRGNRHRRSSVDSDGSPDSLTRVDIVQWSRCRGWRSRPCLEAEGVCQTFIRRDVHFGSRLATTFCGPIPPSGPGRGTQCSPPAHFGGEHWPCLPECRAFRFVAYRPSKKGSCATGSFGRSHRSATRPSASSASRWTSSTSRVAPSGRLARFMDHDYGVTGVGEDAGDLQLLGSAGQFERTDQCRGNAWPPCDPR